MQRMMIFILTLVIVAGGFLLPLLTAGPGLHTAHAAKKSAKKSATKYTCPMHPHYIANEMGNCPICGMDLVALSSGEESASGDQRDGKRQAT